MNTHNRRASLTAPLTLFHTHTHTRYYSTSALFIRSMLIHSQDWRRALGAAEALPFSLPLHSPCLSFSLPPLISLFPSFSVWKVSVKGPRWKAALNGSVIAETALAAQGATRNAHSESLHPTKMRAAIVHSLCMCNIREMLHMHSFITQIYFPAACRQYLCTGNHKSMNVMPYGDDVMCNGTHRRNTMRYIPTTHKQ